MRALVAGWFSIDAGRATAGDILVRDVVCSWLDERDLAYDIAQERQFGSGVDWFRVAPTRYSHFVFVCGPVGKDLAVYELIERFSACRRIAVNVTVLDEAAEESFDLMLARDGVGDPRPDLALAAYVEHPPVMALVKMNDYPGARVDIAHGAFDRLLRARESSAFEVDTVLDQHVPGRRTAAEVQALLGRADLVLTTRLHGLVLALPGRAGDRGRSDAGWREGAAPGPRTRVARRARGRRDRRCAARAAARVVPFLRGTRAGRAMCAHRRDGSAADPSHVHGTAVAAPPSKPRLDERAADPRSRSNADTDTDTDTTITDRTWTPTR